MGISSVLGAFSLIGFLLFLGGIALVVLAASQGRPVRNGIMLAIVGIIAGVLFSVISQGILIVQPTEIAVVFNTLSGQLEEPRTSGTHIIVPVIQQVTMLPLNQQEYTMSSTISEGAVQGEDAVDATTIDGQTVKLDVTIFYSIDGSKANQVYQRWPQGFVNYIRSTSRTVVRDVVATFRADAIYGEGRNAMQQQINEQMTTEFAKEGFNLNAVDVRGLQFSAQFTQAIENKNSADQAAQQAAIVVQQRQQEAAQLRAQAEGQRDAAITIAQGQAQATVLQAQAQAEALRLVSEQIAANPMLIQYQYIQSLAPDVRIALVPSNSPFLFDFSSIAGNSDFTAPPIPQLTDIVTDTTATPTPSPTPGR